MRLRLNALADVDIGNLYARGCEDFGEATADLYFDGLLEAFERIRRFPSGAPRRVVEGHEFRVLRYRSHSIVHQVLSGEVVIVRVLHGAQDAKRHLQT